MDEIDFALTLRSLPDTSAVMAALIRRATSFGFPTIALGNLPRPDYPYPDDFVLSNWAEEWRTEYFQNGYGLHDPVRLAAGMISAPMTLTEIVGGKAGFTPSPAALAILEAARKHGCVEGLIVPVFAAHGYRGLVCFFGDRAEPDPRERITLQHIALHGFHRLRDLHLQTRLSVPGSGALTPREIAVLRAARDGQRDAATAAHLGVAIRTVRFHFENARRKLGATSRAEALARAINLHLL